MLLVPLSNPRQDRRIETEGHCPVSGRASKRRLPICRSGRYRALMLGWESINVWGRRGSDVGARPPVSPIRDLMLEAVIAHEQVELLFQPIIDVATGRIA